MAGINDTDSLEAWRVAYLGRRGRLTLFLRSLAQLDLEERRVAGAMGNQAKGRLEELLDERSKSISEAQLTRSASEDRLDVTLPGRPLKPTWSVGTLWVWNRSNSIRTHVLILLAIVSHCL